MSLFNELKRRNVFRVAFGYIVSSWLLAQVADLVLENIAAPDWVMQTIMLLLALGFPVVVFFSWAYEVTSDGIKRESEIDRAQSITHVTGRKLDRAITAALVLALGYFAFDKFVLSTAREAASIEAAVEEASAQAEVVLVSDNSIAVLPFVNMSDDASNEFFSDGLSEELLNLLAKIPNLRVIARTSSFAYKGKDVKIADVANELNVGHVLEGSVRKAGNQVRITAQLIRASDSSHLWSENYDRTLDNIFVIQEEIASAVVEQLKVTLLGSAPTVQETDPEAYTLYLQARQLGYQNTAESLERSNALYQQALGFDANYAAVWDGLATNYNQQAVVGLRPIDEGMDLAREAANRALAIDPDYAPAHAELSYIAMTGDGDLVEAARHLELALALEPGNTDILRMAATLYRTLGRLDRAVALSEYAVTLDPVNTNGFFSLGVINRFSGKPDAALAAFQTALSLSPGRIGAQYGISNALLLKGEPEAALEVIQQEASAWRLIGIPLVYHALGRSAESDAALAALIEEYEQEAAYNIAFVLAFRGEADRAFEWLDLAVQYNDPGLADLPIEILFANIHDDPRWLPFLERLGKSPAQLDAIKFEVTLAD